MDEARGDPAIRVRVHEFVNAECAPGSVVIDEYGIGSNIADVAVFEPCGLRLFEIKSDLDNTSRLHAQGFCYSQRASLAYLVCGDRHLAAGMTLVPLWWGILRDMDAGLVMHREPLLNPNLSPFFICESLWRHEVLSELRARGLAAGMSKRDKVWLRSLLAKSATAEELHPAVYGHVAARVWNFRKGPKVRTVPERRA